MGLFRDIQSKRLLHLKGWLFFGLGALAVAGLLIDTPTLRTAVLVAVAIWAFCRFYYYLFYVLEKYAGSDRKYAGLFDAIRHLVSNRR